MGRPRIVLAENHAQVAAGIRGLLEPEFAVIDCVANGQALIAATMCLGPAAVLIDISMPVMNGLEAAARLRALGAPAKRLFLSQHAEQGYIEAAFRSGGHGYVVKRAAPAELAEALRTVLRGGSYLSQALAAELAAGSGGGGGSDGSGHAPLTARQRQLLGYLADGKSQKDMAALLDISELAVAFIERGLQQKLGLTTTEELSSYARRNDSPGKR